MKQIEIGKIYRHFKGNYYFVEDIALDLETKERVVIYRPLYERKDSKIWVRREEIFLEEIQIERPDNITRQKYRFELQDNLSKDYTVK